MHKGIYCLVLKNTSCALEVGSLGVISFRQGFHVYVGSALGPGGLARVTRHIRCARDGCEHPHWHIDYLLDSEHFVLARVHCFPTNKRMECCLASILPGDAVRGFGCGDCHCTSHLFSYTRDPGEILTQKAAILGLSAHSKTIKT